MTIYDYTVMYYQLYYVVFGKSAKHPSIIYIFMVDTLLLYTTSKQCSVSEADLFFAVGWEGIVQLHSPTFDFFMQAFLKRSTNYLWQVMLVLYHHMKYYTYSSLFLYKVFTQKERQRSAAGCEYMIHWAHHSIFRMHQYTPLCCLMLKYCDM